MALTAQDTTKLVAAIPSILKARPQQFLLSLFFPTIVVSDAAIIEVDVENGKRRVAPFVNPLVEGKIVDGSGYRTNLIKPAYVKPKAAIAPQDALKRAFGEQLPGFLSPEERLNMLALQRIEEFIAMIERREEIMAADQLINGQLTIVG